MPYIKNMKKDENQSIDIDIWKELIGNSYDSVERKEKL